MAPQQENRSRTEVNSGADERIANSEIVAEIHRHQVDDHAPAPNPLHQIGLLHIVDQIPWRRANIQGLGAENIQPTAAGLKKRSFDSGGCQHRYSPRRDGMHTGPRCSLAM
jgi:hypothetical protein